MSNHPADIAITKEQIAGMPIASFPGTIIVIDSHDEARAAIDALRANGIVGFDTETKPIFHKGKPNTVALVQISTETHCYLFRLKKLGFIPELIAFFEDASVTKIGLSLRDDFMSLHKVAEFEPKGFIDLQDMVGEHEIHDISLQKVYAIVFAGRISKGQRLSNWEAPQLTEAQQLYASTDAWACLKIYHHLKNGLFDPSTSPYHQPQQAIPAAPAPAMGEKPAAEKAPKKSKSTVKRAKSSKSSKSQTSPKNPKPSKNTEA